MAVLVKRQSNSRRPAARKAARAQQQTADELLRRFDGKQALDAMLAASGALGDVDDVVEAFRQAVSQNVPPQPVIMALWEDEPRFERPSDAEALFSNLLGLYELVASGQPFVLGERTVPKSKRPRVTKPAPLADAVEAGWLDEAWRYLDDWPKERERLSHAFDNRQDALVSELDAAGLSDAAFAAVASIAFEVFAMLEVGERTVGRVTTLRADVKGVPQALLDWADEGVTEAEADEEQPLPEAEAEATRALARRVVMSLWHALT